MQSLKNTYWFATDLDGTLIPIQENKEEHVEALKLIATCARSIEDRAIVFVTGRDFNSVLQVMAEVGLPIPHSIICDVGASIYDWNGCDWVRNAAYKGELDAIVQGWDVEALRERFQCCEAIELQEPEKQSEHKLSFYCEGEQLVEISKRIAEQIVSEAIPYSIVSSVDPFTNQGLIDFLPKGVNKRFAIRWFEETCANGQQQLVFAGDSGNDLAVFQSGIPSIVVNNTPASVKAEVRGFLQEEHEGNPSLVYFSDRASTSGVLQGLIFFQWYQELPTNEDRDSLF